MKASEGKRAQSLEGERLPVMQYVCARVCMDF